MESPFYLEEVGTLLGIACGDASAACMQVWLLSCPENSVALPSPDRKAGSGIVEHPEA